jgi:hypothetical protein
MKSLSTAKYQIDPSDTHPAGGSPRHLVVPSA